MQYFTLRWFTISNFNEEKLKIFHSLERALNSVNKNQKNLCWYRQTENYLKQEFKNILSEQRDFNKLKIIDGEIKNFLKQNFLTGEELLQDINFIHKCDKFICHQAHTHKNTSDLITSFP